jgi:hypothetical protein
VSSLPLNANYGKKWVYREDVWPARLNWKTIFEGVGSEIDALDIKTSLVSRYPFNDSLNDAQGSNNLSGSASYVSGIYGKALSLSTTRVQASAQTVHEFGTSDFAFTFWFRPSAINATHVIIGKRDPASATNKGYRIYVNSSGKLVAEYCDGTASVITVTSATTLVVNALYFIKVTFDRDGNLEIFINEASDATGSIAGQQGSIATNGQTFTVGGDSSAAQNYVAGWIDQLQVFSAVLSNPTGQEIYGNVHGGQLAHCNESGSGFTVDHYYKRNAENTAWKDLFDSIQLLTYADLRAQAEMRFSDSDSSNYIGFKAPGTVSANKIWTLPGADGTSKQVLATDGAGVLSFIDPNMDEVNFDDTSNSASADGTEKTLKTYNLPANSFRKILVMVAGTISFPDNLDTAGSVSVRLKFGSVVKKSQTHSYPDWPTGISGSVGHSVFLMYSQAQTAAETITVTITGGTATNNPIVDIDTLYVFGLQ